MIDRRRAQEQRLRRAQALADEVRDRNAELQETLRERALVAGRDPIPLGPRRRSAMFGRQAFPDDVC